MVASVLWFGNGFSTTLSLAIVIDVSTLSFDFAHPAVPGETLQGTWRFLSTVPPECGPPPSVDPGGTDAVDQGDVTATDTDLGGNERTAVPLSPPGIALVLGPMGLVVTLSVASSIAAVLVRHRRRKDPDPPGDAR